MIMQVRYDTMYCCDMVGYLSNDVISGALQV